MMCRESELTTQSGPVTKVKDSNSLILHSLHLTGGNSTDRYKAA